MAPWPTLILRCEASQLEAAEVWLLERLAEDGGAGFLGSRVEPERDGRTLRLILTFQGAADRDRVQERLARGLDGEPLLHVAGTGTDPDTDWLATVAATEKPVPLGRRFAALPGSAAPLGGRVGLKVARARAFGTGEHPSTRMAAALVEEEAETGRPFLDLGAGTGLLAAVAASCGAAPSLAVEIDPVAAAVAGATARTNALASMHVVAGGLDCLLPSYRIPVVAANIERDALLALLPGLVARVPPGGRIILSGLLLEQVDDLAAAGRRLGLAELERREEGEWGALLLTPRPGLLPRVVIPPQAAPAASGAIALPGPEAHHLVRVRRVAPGDAVEIVDGQGGCWTGRLEAGRGTARLVDLQPREPQVEPDFPITLLQGWLQESGRMEMVLRQATELGATAVVPMITARTQGAARRRTPPPRWERVVLEAVKQCGRLRAPELRPAVRLDEVLARPAAPGEVSLFLDPAGEPAWDVAEGPPPRGVRLLVGPEGGLTGAERRAVRAAGFVGVRLGPRILRAETAAAAGLALILARWA